MIYNRLLSNLDKINILTDKQYGFREKYSTYMAVINLVDQISDELDKKYFTLDIFIDLFKAFDTINYIIILDKLQIYGIRCIANDWFKSYLANRNQYVQIDNTRSNILPIVCGVPHGSILGPLLFILYIYIYIYIYIYDFVRACRIANMIMFADDTNLIFF